MNIICCKCIKTRHRYCTVDEYSLILPGLPLFPGCKCRNFISLCAAFLMTNTIPYNTKLLGMCSQYPSPNTKSTKLNLTNFHLSLTSLTNPSLFTMLCTLSIFHHFTQVPDHQV